MPLDPTDPYYLAEVVPRSIDVLGRGLCQAYNRPSGAFGAKGNTVHYSGYHRSRQWILKSRDSAYGSADYSVRQALDKTGDERWISAFDFTPGQWGTPANRALMRELTGRVYTASKARDPRLSAMREFAGTLNGTSVITFNCADGSIKGAFDSSHLDHVHGSLWRSRAANDHTGILHVMLGIEDDMDEAHAALLRAMGDNWSPNQAEYLAAGGSAATWQAMANAGMVGANGRINRLGSTVTQLGAELADVKAAVADLSIPAPAPVDVPALVAALVADPAFAKLLQQSAFEGAQRAESE